MYSNPTEKKLAIVIPFYKIDFFRECLLSINNQTNKAFNLYIGNDASRDNPKEIIQKHLKDIDYQYFEYKKNLGSKSLPLQWERLISETGDEKWILILGDDDVLDSTICEKFYDTITEDEQTSTIRFATQLINDNGEKTSDIYTHPKEELFADFLQRYLKKETRSSLSEYFFKTEIVKEKKFRNYPLAWYSDTIAIADFTTNSIKSVNDSIVFVRVGKKNISGNKHLNYEKFKATYMFYIDILDEKIPLGDLKKTIYKQIQYYWSRIILNRIYIKKTLKLLCRDKEFFKIPSLIFWQFYKKMKYSFLRVNN